MSNKSKEYQGYVSNRSIYFETIKIDMKNRRNRFKQTTGYRNSMNKKSPAAYKFNNPDDQKSDEYNLLLNKDNGTQSLLSSSKTTQDSMDIELGGKPLQQYSSNQIPHEWAEYYEKTINLMEEINKTQLEVQKLSNERIKLQFGSSKDLDQQIHKKSTDITEKLRKCEKNLSSIDQAANMMNETEQDKKVRENIKRSLAIQIQEITLKFRGQQKKLFTTLTKYDSVSSNKPEEPIRPPWQPISQDESEQQDCDLMIEYSQQRDDEINQLVETMNELSTIFKQLNNLVIDQGTLLDRIDFNVESTQQNVTQAVKHLVKAEKYQNSPCAKRTINFLIMMIVILSFILVIKYTTD